MTTNQPPLPALCDVCRAAGTTADDRFAHLADLLDFTPVPVRRHANNWTPEHQRAFVAALATVGNERAAARSIGRYPAGADRLRKSPRGRSFREACENAIDLYHERELALLKESLVDLDAAHREALEDKRCVAEEMDYHRPYEEPPGEELDEDYVREVRARITEKFDGCKSLFLMVIADNPAKRAAWEELCGPVDWDSIRRGEVQASTKVPNMRDPEWVVTCEHIDPVEGIEGADEGEDFDETKADEVLHRWAARVGAVGAPQIEGEQARSRLGEPRAPDLCDLDESELKARGFRPGADGVWIKDL